tara:strand:- start:831 stop:1493 length:663 start_codon:yes stop_codon:yes gene_type:complete
MAWRKNQKRIRISKRNKTAKKSKYKSLRKKDKKGKQNKKLRNNTRKTKRKNVETEKTEKMEKLETDIFIAIKDKKNSKDSKDSKENKKIILKNKDFVKTLKYPSAWKKLISKNDPQILLLNNKGINLMIIAKNNKIEALRSVCPHMGVNNMWSGEGKGKFKCWAHGNVFKSGKDLKKYKVIKKNDSVEIILPNDTFSIFSGGKGKINEKCNHLRDIEDLV